MLVHLESGIRRLKPHPHAAIVVLLAACDSSCQSPPPFDDTPIAERPQKLQETVVNPESAGQVECLKLRQEAVQGLLLSIIQLPRQAG